MKATVRLTLKTAYDDGAGNTCKYSYDLLNVTYGQGQVVNILDADVWKMHAFVIKLPRAALSGKAAGAISSSVGAPPAYGTRTISISAAGKITVGSNEALESFIITVTFTEVPTHTYDKVSIICNADIANFSTLLLTGVGGATKTSSTATDILALDDQDAIKEAVATSAQFTLTAAARTALLIPSMTFMTVESDLLNREYTGMYIEAVGKSVIGLVQIMNKRYEGVVSEAVDYLMGKDGPLTMHIPLVEHSAAIV